MSKKMFLTAALVAATMALHTQAWAALSDFQAGSFTSSTGIRLPYRIYIPPTYSTSKQYPMILFLHGLGEAGTNNTSQVNGNISNLVAHVKMPAYECILLAPQCDGWWNADWVIAAGELVEQIMQQYSIDQHRMICTGLSMGGIGTWDMIQRQPYLFAAAVPICGSGDLTLAFRMKDQSVWAFHGELDGSISVMSSRNMVSAIRACGGDPQYTEYPGAGHGVWGMAYATEELYPWLFSKTGQGVFTDNPPQAVGPRLDYTVEDLGGGLKAYTFKVINDDGHWLPYQVNFAFKGVGRATIRQMAFYGAVPVNTEADATTYNGLGTPAYDKARDSWACAGWSVVPGVHPLDGTNFTGFAESDDCFAVSIYTGASSTLGTNVPALRIVADGDVYWTGKTFRSDGDINYPVTHEFPSAGSTQFPGDFNSDGAVNQADYTDWADGYGQTGRALAGDANLDGVIDQADYTTWADHFGQVRPQTVSNP